MVLINDKFINDNEWFFTRGLPNTKLLHKWIYKLDLESVNFLLTDPLDVRNFVVYHTHYTSDKIAHGMNEHWIQNENEMYGLLRTKKDDCDGVAMLTTSLLFSLGYNNAHLAIGYYGVDPDPTFCNHAYCLLHDPNEPDDPYLLETTGDDIIDELPRLSLLPNYTTMASCNGLGEYYLYNMWEDKFNETI